MQPLRLDLPFGRAELDAVQAVVREKGRELGLRPRVITHLVFLIEEAGTNILQHSGATWMEVVLEAMGGDFRLVLRDDGEEFDSVEAAGYYDEPVVGEAIERHLGLWMMGRLSFNRLYRRLKAPPGGKDINELTFSTHQSDPEP